MKRILLVLLLITLAACSALPAKQSSESQPKATEVYTSPTAEPTNEPLQEVSTQENPEMVVFADLVLEAIVRGAMGKPDGITVEDAKTVTRLDVSSDWQRYLSEEKLVEQLDGLEFFTNLEYLDLSNQAITDLAPLAGLNHLTVLALGNNAFVDITPLAELTSLKTLILTNCLAQDYSSLANLINLEVLILNNSTITDVSPLAELINLKSLYLAGCSASYSPLVDIYTNLEDKDFIIPSTLAELGFIMNDERHQAEYWGENFDIRLNHDGWGFTGEEWTQNIVRVVFGGDGYKVDIGYYPIHNGYVVQAVLDGEMVVNYFYSFANESDSVIENRESLEQHIHAIFPDASEDEDILLAPIRFHDNVLRSTYGISADELFELPFEPPSLQSLGFVKNEEVQGWLYVHESGDYFDISIHDPEQEAWEEGGEVRFFAPLSDEYRIVVTCHINENWFSVKADDNFGGGAQYKVMGGTKEIIDIWCSDNNLTVEEYFKKAINNPAITDAYDIYHYAIKRMVRTIEDTFGMEIEQLYALLEQ